MHSYVCQSVGGWIEHLSVSLAYAHRFSLFMALYVDGFGCVLFTRKRMDYNFLVSRMGYNWYEQ